MSSSSDSNNTNNNTNNNSSSNGKVLEITSDIVRELGFKIMFAHNHVKVERMGDGQQWYSKFYEKDFVKTIDTLEEHLKTKTPMDWDTEITKISECVRLNFDRLMEHNQQQQQKQKANGKAVGGATSGGDDGDGQTVIKVPTLKYTTGKDTFNPRLWETVRVGSSFCFVSYDPATGNIVVRKEIQGEDDNASKLLLPSTEPVPEPYGFTSRAQLQEYVTLAKGHTIASLFRDVRNYIAKFYDTDTGAYIDLIAADIVFTYFQDRIGKTHYIFIYGDPGNGKGAILECFNQLGYRALMITDETAPTIYRSLGNVEKGQVVLVIDEANDLEKNPTLVTILKVGYKGNTKVPRVMDAQSSVMSRVEYFYAYSFKILAAERLPSRWATGGFMDRCFKIQAFFGTPEKDITDIVDNAGDPDNAEILGQLTHLRKLLFAYRLLHYHEPIPDIQLNEGISGRDRELVKPLLRLFVTHGHEDSKYKETIDELKKSLHYFVKQRNTERIEDEATAEVLRLVKEYIVKIGNVYEFAFSDFWNYLKDELNGEYITNDDDDGDGDNSNTNSNSNSRSRMRVDILGEISKRKLGAILHKSLGGKQVKDPTGKKRLSKFDQKTLDRMSTKYRVIPDTLDVEEHQTTLNSSAEVEEEN